MGAGGEQEDRKPPGNGRNTRTSDSCPFLGDFSKNSQIGWHLVFRFRDSCWAGPGSASGPSRSFSAVHACLTRIQHSGAQVGHLQMGSSKWQSAGTVTILPGTNVPRETMIRIKISYVPHRALTRSAEQDRVPPSSVSTLIIKPKWS